MLRPTLSPASTRAVLAIALCLVAASTSQAQLAVGTAVGQDTPSVAPTAAAVPSLRFLARLHAPLQAPVTVHDGLIVFHARDGGTLAGPALHGVLESPTGDWVRVLPDGTMRVDVRASARLDDGAPLYITYGGVLAKPDAASWQRFLDGERIEAPDWHYVVTPNFETASSATAGSTACRRWASSSPSRPARTPR